VSLKKALLLGLLAYFSGRPPHSEAIITPAAVGTQDGAFSVNASGGASYQMDLDVPPGTQGVQPSLSIWYVSQSTNGLLGNGFALQGLSSITRCQATAKLDGYNGGVGFDAKDRYCLDGQRLVKISGGSDYGAAGSVYHTEYETWTKVVANGTCGSGPCSFTVTNKDGHTLAFGNGTSGVRLPDRDEVAAWQIASTTDLNGNRVSVTYKFNADSLQNLPAEIRYTENQNAGIAATRKVTFEYEPRSQKIPRYIGGYLFLLENRLKAVRTWLDGAEVLAYNLTYTVSEGTGRDLLQALQKCAPQRVCYPATTFAYTTETNTYVTPNDRGDGELRRNWCTEPNALIGWMDFNADGLPDVHCDTPEGTHRVLLSTGTALESPNDTNDGLIRKKWCTGNAFPSWIDFNGDAKADLACDGEDGSHRVLVSDGANVKSPNKNEDGLVKSSWCGGPTSRPQWGNLNEDGRADLLCSSTDGIQRALISTGTGVTTPNEDADGVVRRSWCASKDAVVLWGDFNGDHMSDAHCSMRSGVQQVLLSNGSKLVTPNKSADGDVANSWCGGSDRRRGLTDFNGDGLLDSTCDSADGRHWVMFSTGRTLRSPNSNSEGLVRSSWCTGSGAVQSWGDFNGDGLSDLQCRDSAGRLLALLSTGSTLKTPNSSADGVVKTGWCMPAQGQPRWTDFNADALNDVTCHSQAGLQQALVHTAGMPDLVSKITDGIGMTVDLTYAPLTDAKVYSAGDPVSYPTLDIRSPMYVVARYVTGDGRGGRYAFKYRYKGARTDLDAQRWLGFQQVAFTEESIGRQTVTNYAQESPLMSFVTSTVILDSKNVRQAEITYEPLVRTPYPNVVEVLVAKESQSTFTFGVADYVATKSFGYDEYGNPDFVADVSNPYYAVYNCQRYANSTTPWRIGYPTAQKTARTEEACRDLDRWNAATDLRWSTTTYDARMNPASRAAWDDVNDTFVTSSETFGPAGNVLTSTDPAGNTTTFTWDETLTYPKGQISPPISGGRHLTTSFTYHRAWDVVATTTDPNGNVSETLIDGFGRTTEVRGPDPDAATGAPAVTLQTFTYAQDINGRYVEMRQRQTWADGNPANWYYERQYQDGLGRIFLERSRSARGVDVAIETLYDTTARVWKSAIPHYNDSGVSYVVYEYDVLDRPTLVVQPDSTITKIEYLKGQLEIRTTDASGTALARTTIDSLDPRFLNLKSVAPNGGVTTSTYDPIGQQIKNVRPAGSSTIATYDSLGRPVKSVDSDSGTSTFSYGKNGLLQSSTDGAGHTVRFEYDALERPKSRTLSPAGGPPEVYLFEYDNPNYANALGELSTSIGPSYTRQYAYSRYGLVAHQQLTLDGNTYTAAIDYDPPGRSVLRTYADGSTLRTAWYVDGTLHRQDLQQPGEHEFTNYATYTSYTALQQPETLLSGNGLRTANTYYPVKEGLARPKTTVVSNGTGEVLESSYAWNRLSQMTSMSRVQISQPMQSVSYAYDKMGWLTSATGTNGNDAFAYDLAGNITEKDGVRYAYPQNSDRVSAASNGGTFEYDGAGNMKQKRVGSRVWQYHHDAASRLAEILLDDKVVATHLYDSTDNRLRRTDASGNVSSYIDGDTDLYQSGNRVLLTKYVIGASGPLATVTTAYTPQALRSALQRQTTLLDAHRYGTGSLPWIGAVTRSLVLRASERITPIAAVAVLLLTSLLFLRRTAYTRRHPLFSSFVPALLCGLVLLTSQELRADLGPGSGYPVAGTLYFHGDQVYSSLLVTTPEGLVSTSVTYEPFGSIEQEQSSGPNNFRAKFTTKEHDDESGLDYFGARYYDSQLGRFLEPDPQSQFASAYVYGANDPIAMYDPDGQFAVLVIVIAAVLGAVTGAYMGGVAANNNNFNPLQWNWSSAHTWAGVFGGAAIGAATGALGAAIGSVAGPAVGIVAEIILSAGENAAFTALAGGSGKEILNAAIIGGVLGGITMGASLGVAKVFSRSASSGGRLARRAERELLPSGSTPGCNCRCTSFAAGTLVATDEGLEPIETVTPGTAVLSTDREPSNVVPFPVLETRNRSNAQIVAVAAGGETIRTTPDHPFWVDVRGWTNASNLRPGDQLVTAEGGRVAVESVKPLAETTKVFNFEVDRGHSYFVSPLRVLVHNPNGRPCTRAYRKTFLDKGHDLVKDVVGGKRVRRPPSRLGAEITQTGRYVNFSPVAVRDVKIRYTGTRAHDYVKADRKAGIKKSERIRRNLVWHHVEGLSLTSSGRWEGRMQLIPRNVHEQWPHWGGVEEWARRTGVPYK
jgi:RHS repeat-associated protein